MTKTSFAQRPLAIMLGLALLASAALPAHAQFVRNTDRTIAKNTLSMQGDEESTAGITRARLTKALPAFWASTQPGQSYMIFNTTIRRGIDGSVTSNEKSGPYTFSPSTSVADVQTKAPDFVALLLGQYATQSRVAMAELTAALQSYFDSTRPGQGTALNGGQTMRNSDGSATFTDGTIIFVFDEGTSALTIATMAPALASALINGASAIETGARAGGYALRDPSNANQLINFDGRVYDTAGNALPNASAATTAALFGNGNGSRGTTASNSGGSAGSGSSSGSAGNSASAGGSNGSGSGGSNANAGSSSSTSGSGGSGSTGNAAGSAGGASNGTTAANAASGSGSGAGSSGGSGGYSSGGVAGSNGSNGAATNAGASTSAAGASGGTSGGTSNTGSNGSVAAGGDAASTGSSATGGVSGTGLNGTTPLSTSSATGVANSNFGNNGTSSTNSSAGGVCHVFRVLGGSGSSTCN